MWPPHQAISDSVWVFPVWVLPTVFYSKHKVLFYLSFLITETASWNGFFTAFCVKEILHTEMESESYVCIMTIYILKSLSSVRTSTSTGVFWKSGHSLVSYKFIHILQCMMVGCVQSSELCWRMSLCYMDLLMSSIQERCCPMYCIPI